MKEKPNGNNNKIITECENLDEIKQMPEVKCYHKEENDHCQVNTAETAIAIKEIEEVFAKAPKLRIEVINSSIEPRGIALTITPYGLEKGLRNMQDGITFFGYENNVLPKTLPTIDYLIRPKDAEYDERYNGRHFQIKFNPSDLKYYLKDLGNGFGSFIQIGCKTVIKHNLLLNIGENYIVFTHGLEEEMVLNENCVNGNSSKTDQLLNVKIFSGNIRHGVLSFTPEKSPLLIGRSPDCEIFIDDSMVSRVNCTITYEKGAWMISDGTINAIEGNKRSTNGTWIYAHDEVEVTDQMTFKSNHNLFFCYYQ